MRRPLGRCIRTVSTLAELIVNNVKVSSSSRRPLEIQPLVNFSTAVADNNHAIGTPEQHTCHFQPSQSPLLHHLATMQLSAARAPTAAVRSERSSSRIMMSPVCSMRTAAFSSTRNQSAFKAQSSLSIVARRQMAQVSSSSSVATSKNQLKTTRTGALRSPKHPMCI
jgi:hypothetical protein